MKHFTEALGLRRYTLYMQDYGGPAHNEGLGANWMRENQPRLLVLWGKYDLSFELSEPEAYRRYVPTAEVHVLEAGHFGLDTTADEIAQLVGGFMSRGGS